MANRQNKIDVVLEYIDIAEAEILKRWHEPTTKDVLRHLIERGIVEPKRLRNYMIIYDFDCMLRKNEGNRTYTFMDLSIKYDISERQAQSIVYKERNKEVVTKNILI
jgi:hypothetical protein|tara:strand:- start:298 stop:618 length:321 start_codon:yes stop_codon:yes gene_type:complete